MNDLIKTEGISAISLFTENNIDPLLEAITEEVKKFTPDISTKKGRDEVASMAYKVAKTKTYLDDLGKDLVSEWKTKSKVVDDSRKKLRDYLDGLKEEVRRPLTDFEEKEKARIKKHENGIAIIEQIKISFGACNTSKELQDQIINLTGLVIDEAWDEFKDKASKCKQDSLAYLENLLKSRIQHEEEQAELEKLRKEKAEREQKEREERIAKEAAEKARLEAEAIAKAEKDKIEIEKAEALRKQQEAEEAVKRAEQRAIQDKLDAENRAKEAAEKAEMAKKAAVEAEKLRVAQEKARLEQEAIARENNLKHKRLINNEALTALVEICSLSSTDAKAVVEAIAKGQIPNIKISY